ncbi:MAG: arylsulfatase [Bacteroidales bacterium]|nr:arylsulfatase [Bacteroidales bacterium]
MESKIITAALLGLACTTACTPKKEKEAKRPNIIYIMTDDMGYNDIGCYGSQRIKTPNIDRLAAEGMRFTHHYAGTSVSAPSRCSLITGKHTGHCQVRGNKEVEPYGQYPLQPNTETVATKLKEAGYTTALIGKWGLGTESTEGDPKLHGFDYYFGYLCQVMAHNHCPEYLIENGERVYLGNKVEYTDPSHWTRGRGSLPVEKKVYSQQLFTDKAVEFIEKNQDRPFFLYFPVVIPHDNGEAAQDKRYSDILSYAPYENEKWTENEKGYAAMITYLDSEIARIMNKLRELGLEENTLVIFTSDNGGDSPDGFHNESNYPFKGHKRDLYEGGIRIPFIAYWKGTIKGGSESDHVSAFWDFLPTVCELSGAAPSTETDGISYLPTLLGKEQPEHDYLYFEFHEQGGSQALIKGDWKCIKQNVKEPSKTTVELYNIREDIGETNDLSSQYPEKVKDFLELMSKARTENEVFKL